MTLGLVSVVSSLETMELFGSVIGGHSACMLVGGGRACVRSGLVDVIGACVDIPSKGC